MLNGIDQQESLDENFDLVKQSVAQGINPMIVSNYQGKEILDSLHELKIEYDRDYFNRQTYKEFLVDPLGAKLIDAWAATDANTKKNVFTQDRLKKAMQGIAGISSIPIDLSAPSKKKQAYCSWDVFFQVE